MDILKHAVGYIDKCIISVSLQQDNNGITNIFEYIK